MADAADPLHHPRTSQHRLQSRGIDGPHVWEFIVFMCVLCLQSDVMQLTDDSTKLKLFMDVLDGTKAAVSPPNHHTVV